MALVRHWRYRSTLLFDLDGGIGENSTLLVAVTLCECITLRSTMDIASTSLYGMDACTQRCHNTVNRVTTNPERRATIPIHASRTLRRLIERLRTRTNPFTLNHIRTLHTTCQKRESPSTAPF